MSDYKLILTSDNDGKAVVRYRKAGDQLWNSFYTDETDMDKMIDEFLDFYKEKYGKAPSQAV